MLPMTRTDAEEITVKLGMFASGLQGLGERLTRQAELSHAELVRAAESLALTAETSARDATAELAMRAGDAIVASAAAAAGDLERAMTQASTRLTRASTALEANVHALRRLHAISAWKALAAAGAAAVFAICGACVLSWTIYKRMDEAAWFDEVQEARAHGRLQPCPEGGVCVYVGKRWHRLGH
ncbi:MULTISPECIES: hypothetical protein [Luteibacter]|uniref:hypothetical protein n=1 Tax=Luteibacter TaxID=242605 RepID=UPI00055A2038|nr:MULTISPECIES: hypothetical protein [unclassified Luteibacter]